MYLPYRHDLRYVRALIANLVTVLLRAVTYVIRSVADPTPILRQVTDYVGEVTER
jgi:hypothetical protein